MKGQVSLEYLFLFSISSSVLLIVLMISFSANINLFQVQDSLASFRNANAVAAAVNYVYLAGNGASYNLSMTNLAKEENITIRDSFVESYRKYSSSSAPLLNDKTSYSSISYSKVIISNFKGEVNISS